MSTQKNGKTQTDPLGYDVYARTLWTRIQAALNKDLGTDGQTKPLGDDPLVVGIFGEWGAGKSHLLKLIQKLAEQASKDQMAQRCLDPQAFEGAHASLAVTVPVYFQPWKYEHEAHLHIPLAVHVADAMSKAWKDLRTGKEDVIAKIDELGKQANTAQATIEKAKSAWDKASELIGQAEKALKSKTAKVVAAAADIGLASVGAPPLIGLARKKLIGYTSPEDFEDTDEHEEGESTKGDAASKANPKAEASTAKEEPKKTVSDSLAHKDDGLSFYRTDRLLHDLTRPKANKAFLKGMGVGVASEIEYDLRINFVVFIDDLDRCLPEKAVQTLELIKTVFNVESFAFVLALDDEVIERGIGHRYKEYKLQDKKPEMPITGFEYLEKIVHLPFRLPPWTAVQAMNFVREYEAKIQPDASLRWFDVPDSNASAPSENERSERHLNQADEPLDLLPLALSAFSAYVPRKLIRMVELMQQVATVAYGNGKPIPRALSSGLDARVILALVLIQLFQPELYRLLRRKYMGFAQLLAAFKNDDGKDGVRDGLHSSNASDLELWAWARFNQSLPKYQGDVRARAYRSQMGSEDATPSPSTVVEALNPYAATVQIIGEAFKDKPAKRYYAEQVRLPIVVQLVEHRAAQRHVFDVLKLLQEMAAMGVSSALRMRDYFSFMSPHATPMNADGQAIASRVPVGNLDVLVDGLLTTDESVRANLAGEIAEGCTISEGAARRLLEKIKEELQSNEANTHLKRQLLQGMYFLAPHIHAKEQKAFWDLVSELGPLLLPDANTPNATTHEPKMASIYLDVRSMLGQDDRFDRVEETGKDGQVFKPLYLLKDRWNNHTEAQEPIAGFVRIEGGQFTSGHQDESNNPVNPDANAGPAFYMARMLTTVDQFRAFVDDDGYKNPDLWHPQGRLWLSGDWDTTIEAQSKDKELPGWLKNRPVDMRKTPMGWDAQKRVGSRAVDSLCWFEAHAYSQWLTARLKDKLMIDGQQYIVTLPNELQWELAARGPQPQRWPWGDKKAEAAKRANIRGSDIRHTSVPGCFSPNAAGFLDMAGNLWEWQNNLYQVVGKAGEKDRFRAPGAEQVGDELQGSGGDWEADDLIAVRGGSWLFGPRDAACSSRGRIQADGWDDLLGFRVMLSLA